MFMQNLPRYPQRFSDLPKWETPKNISPEIVHQWEQRACGLACLRSLLEYYNLPVPSQWSLIKEAQSIKAFSPQGILHKKLVLLAEKHGLSGVTLATNNEFEIFELSRKIDLPAIISVKHKLPSNSPQKGGHLVVVKSTEKVNSVLLSDPSHWRKDYPVLPVTQFSSYSGRSIIIAPPMRVKKFMEEFKTQ